jgi:hypothetical protein
MPSIIAPTTRVQQQHRALKQKHASMAYQETCPVARKPSTTAFTRSPTVGWGGGETKFSKTKPYHDKFNSKALLVAKFRCLPDP